MPDRTCPLCGNPQVISPENIKEIYPGCHWEVPEGTAKTCAYCQAAKVDGEWVRTVSVNERAQQMKWAQGKDRDREVNYYKEKLTA